MFQFKLSAANPAMISAHASRLIDSAWRAAGRGLRHCGLGRRWGSAEPRQDGLAALDVRTVISWRWYVAVSWFGCTHPDKVAEIMQGCDDGLLARFMWFWPDAKDFDRPNHMQLFSIPDVFLTR